MLTKKELIDLVEQGIKAPSGHNTQPWLFRIITDRIEIHPDTHKTLPVVDPENRELFISLGCAAENVYQAAQAKDYNPKVEIDKSGFITIGFQRNNIADCRSDSRTNIIETISQRQSNRRKYTNERISTNLLKELKDIRKNDSIDISFFENGTKEYTTISDFIYEGNRIQLSNPAFVNELKSWMRYNEKHVKQANDGLSYAVFGAPNLPRFIAEPIISSFLKPGKQNKTDRKKLDSSSHLVLFTCQTDEPVEWILLGRVLERFLLKTTELDIAHAYCNQPCELPELAMKIQQVLQLGNKIPVILLRIGFAERNNYSPRKDKKEILIE